MFNYGLKKPKISLLFLLLFTIVGFLTFFQLPQREIPEVSFDITTITTPYPGAPPDVVERTITNPLEEGLLGISGVTDITSVSTSGISTIFIELESADAETVSAIRQTVSNVQGSFPEEVSLPNISSDVQMGALSSYHLLSDERHLLYDLYPVISKWKTEIERIQGVKGVIIKGIPNEVIHLTIDYNDLFESGLSFQDVLYALDGEMNTFPLGIQEMEGTNFQLTILKSNTLTDLEDLYIGNTYTGEPIFIKDVGTVEITRNAPTDLITYENTPALSFTVLQEKGTDIPSLDKEVHEKMPVLADELPGDIILERFYTQQTIISQIFGDLTKALLFSILAVIIVTLLGLNISSAFIVAIAIPVSIFMGMVPLPFLKVDLNQISIIGIIIALGILVDDAIVVGDNIQRKYKEGYSPLAGAIAGSKEVRVSIITSTLAIVFTFLPLVFLTGVNGDFIRAMPSILITTIVASTIVSLTLVPIFLIWRRKAYLKSKDQINITRDGVLGKQLDRLAEWYSIKILSKVVRKPWKIGLTGLLICTLCYGLITFIPIEFFPSADRSEVTVEVKLPVGTTLENTELILQEMSEMILSKDNTVTEHAIYAGSGLPPLFNEGMTNTGEETGEILFRINKDLTSAADFIERWTDELHVTYPDAVLELTTIEAGPPVGAPIAIKISGPDLDTINEIGEKLEREIYSFPDTRLVVNDQGVKRPTYQYIPNRDIMNKHGFTLQEISQQINVITDGIPYGVLDDGNDRREIQINIDLDSSSLESGDILIPSKSVSDENGIPEFIPLDEIVSVTSGEMIPIISHENGQRTLTIRVYPIENQQELEEDIAGVIGELQTRYDDYSISLGGETELRDDFFLELLTLFIIVIFLIYIVMAVQFNSLLMPVLIMSTVYLAITGAIIGLFITQTGLGFMAMMGIVSLAGIVVRNSIVLIEFIEQRRKDGINLEEAVLEAGKVRLKPILLTAFTAIAALLPVAFSGDVLFVPLSISIISGLFFSAVLTLILVPAFYTAIKQ
ncbi:efflux RND transporter permease subunit [Evansella tamaricis]|uniref:Efflux RND transporter permease subunit n=1 Tax=Evansella tamaricis TaxID=2069301 RepID=A0ABS6JCT1_9BACI|nr:efflux RND transporter permease subunit [Evansella tamaricis]MBU9711478.1 efflux RND transporter permease subunit [Evansella tamaricis]